MTRDQTIQSLTAQLKGYARTVDTLEKQSAAARAMLAALEQAEDFMRGFEGDETQEGIDAKLRTINCAIAQAKVAGL